MWSPLKAPSRGLQLQTWQDPLASLLKQTPGPQGQFLTQWVWREAREFAFLSSSQVRLMLLIMAYPLRTTALGDTLLKRSAFQFKKQMCPPPRGGKNVHRKRGSGGEWWSPKRQVQKEPGDVT